MILKVISPILGSNLADNQAEILFLSVFSLARIKKNIVLCFYLPTKNCAETINLKKYVLPHRPKNLPNVGTKQQTDAVCLRR